MILNDKHIANKTYIIVDRMQYYIWLFEDLETKAVCGYNLSKLEKTFAVTTKMKVTKGKAETLLKRIEKYKTYIIRFVSNPDLEYHNNRGECQIRPIVVIRKNFLLQ
jgi:hypothetical protein